MKNARDVLVRAIKAAALIGCGKTFMKSVFFFCLIVFGFSTTTFMGAESSNLYSVEVGYQKGAFEVQENVDFTVSAIPGTAS